MQVFYEKLTVDDHSTFLYVDIKLSRFTSPLHIHDEFELILIKNSVGKLFTGSTVNNFKNNDLFFFAPGLSHCFYNDKSFPKSRKYANAIVVHFKKDFLGNDFLNRSETAILKKLFVKSRSGIYFKNADESLKKKFIHLGKLKGLVRITAFLNILDELSSQRFLKLLTNENMADLANLQDSKRITDVYSYVAENFDKEISFTKAASIANMQKSAFCRYFKRKTKKKFSSFVSEVRVAHALKLLTETDKTVSEIAFDCGFNNISFFHRQFKYFQGVSPGEMRTQSFQKINL